MTRVLKKRGFWCAACHGPGASKHNDKEPSKGAHKAISKAMNALSNVLRLDQNQHKEQPTFNYLRLP